MAKEAVAEAEVIDGEEGAAGAVPKSGKKKLIIIIAAVLLVGGGAGTFFLLRGGKAEHAKVEKKIVLPLQFYAMDPAFVVNFEASSVSRFLQIEVRVGTREPEVLEVLKANEPVIRNDLLLLFSNQKYEDIATGTGKDALRHKALKVIQDIVAGAGGKAPAVEAVYFTSFVMQ